MPTQTATIFVRQTLQYKQKDKGIRAGSGFIIAALPNKISMRI
jgi:hypothetical protein